MKTTTDRAQNLSHRKEYAREPQTLSPATKSGLDMPINIALWGSAEISLSRSIDLMAYVFLAFNEQMIRDVYQKIEKPKRRIAFGYGFIFADAVHQLKLRCVGWKNTATASCLIPSGVFEMPVYCLDVRYTFADLQWFLSEALIIESDAISKLARATEDRSDAATLAIALKMAHTIQERADGAGVDYLWDISDPEPEKLAIEMMVRWLDEWAEMRLREDDQEPAK